MNKIEEQVSEVLAKVKSHELEVEEAKKIFSDIYNLGSIGICSRCKTDFNQDWEACFNTFTLELSHWDYVEKAMFGDADPYKIKEWSWGAKIDERGATYIKVKSGTHSSYRLCRQCHDNFLKAVGDWFKG